MPIQEEISQRASPNRCDGRDDDDPEEIQPSITRGEHSTHRKDGNAPKIEGMEDHRSSRNAERRRSAAGASNASPGPLKRLVRRTPSLGGTPCRGPRALRLVWQLDEHEVVSRIEVVVAGFVDNPHVARSGHLLVVQHAVDLTNLEILGP